MNRIVKGALVGAGIFAVSAASASALNVAGAGSFFTPAAQQSDDISATCTNGSVEYTFVADSGATVADAVRVQQQNIQGCLGKDFEVTINLPAGVAESYQVRYGTPGADLLIPIDDTDISDIQSSRLTILGDIRP